jgi:hypothetical protein
VSAVDRREVLTERRAGERRASAAAAVPSDERRSGRDRRADDRRAWDGDRRQVFDRRLLLPTEPRGGRRRTDWTALPPLSRLIPALVVVLASATDLGVAQATGAKAWAVLLVLAAVPIAAYDLAKPGSWRWHVAVVWFLVGIYVAAAALHITYLLTR